MIYINPVDENTVWVTTDDDAIGIEVVFDTDVEYGEDEKVLIALTEYLGYDPRGILSFDSIDNGISWRVVNK